MAVTQPNMQAHEELAALFSRNLSLDPSKVQHQQVPQPQEPQATSQPPQIIYSITQHYNHSAHIARPQQQQQQFERPSSEPPRSEHQASEAILASHGVDPSALSQSQLQLFKEAGDSQKLRLLELWTIYPPASSSDNSALAFSSTSLEQEEQLARMRYEQQEQQRHQQEQEQQAAAMSLDGTSVPVPFQGGDGRWLIEDTHHYMMEPYMSSGYEELARREYNASAGPNDGPLHYKPAMDPVYKSVHSPIDWAMRQQAMEDQYGSYAQCRMEI